MADLFGMLWRRLDKGLPQLIPTGWPSFGRHEIQAIKIRLDRSRNGSVPQDIRDWVGQTLASVEPLDIRQLQQLLILAVAIDDWFSPLHPRYPLGAATLDPARQYYRNLRVRLGRYNQNDDGTWVIPKAPLRPDAADKPSNQTKIGSQFNYLSAGYLPIGGPRQVAISVWRRGRDIEPVAGAIKIAFIPLAEDQNDLSFTQVKRGTAAFLDVGLTDETALADRVQRALEIACRKGAHLCMLPELCVSPAIAQRIGKTLGKIGASSDIRLVVAGSGLYPASTGLSNNACIVFDRIGRLLWRQDKINPYQMAPRRLEEFQIDPSATVGHIEDIQPGDTLHIQDSDGLGRMMVLICEDLAQPSPGDHAREAIPPDWVFAPILDGSIDTGRWVHQKAYTIAGSSGARVVVANSMTLNARKKASTTDNIGLCVDDNMPRRTKIVPSMGPSPVVVLVEWDPATWPDSTLGLTP